MNKIYTPEEDKKFLDYHSIVKQRLFRGESEASAYRDKPPGYSEWVKYTFEHFNKHLHLPPRKKIKCTSCAEDRIIQKR